MKIKNGVITEATEIELYKHWLKSCALKSHDYNAFSLCHEGANGCHSAHDQNKAGLYAIQCIDLEYEYIAKTHAQLWQRGLTGVL